MDEMGETTSWLITGASQGFGKALAAEVLSRGEVVLAVVRDEASLEDLAERYPGRLSVARADLRDQTEIDRVVAAVRRLPRVPDVLVNNAGRAIIGSAEEVTLEQVRELMELNFWAAAALVRAVLPGMRARRSGTIVQMSSQGAVCPFPEPGRTRRASSRSRAGRRPWPVR